MRKDYWNSEIQKNWNGELRTEMLDQNILCYGKPNSGKTEKVIKPFLRRAIEKNNSILLVVTSEKTDFSDVLTLAECSGYTIQHYTPFYEMDVAYHDVTDKGFDLLEQIMAGPVFTVAYMPSEKKYAYSSVQAALFSLFNICNLKMRGCRLLLPQ